MPDRSALSAAHRVVVKVGTRVLTHDDGRLALARLFGIVEAIAAQRDRQMLLVSSGAVGLGREALGMAQIPDELVQRQICAAVGQPRLMELLSAGFGRLGVTIAQVLLSQQDFDVRARYLHLRATLLALLERGVLPVINENDAVSVDELELHRTGSAARPVFGDNDRLGALVAAELNADLLVLLTDVAGLYDRDPRRYEDARLLSRYTRGAADATEGSGAGRGGMRSKLDSAQIAARGGCHVVIASGREPDALERVLAGEDVGTWFPAASGMSARRRWIAWAAAPRGALHLDDGAVQALTRRGASLLAAGVHQIEGEFAAGDVVELHTPSGAVFARGVCAVGAAGAREWMKGRAPSGARSHHALVHRDALVLLHS